LIWQNEAKKINDFRFVVLGSLIANGGSWHPRGRRVLLLMMAGSKQDAFEHIEATRPKRNEPIFERRTRRVQTKAPAHL
jgi:hypothetical protein